MLSRVTQCIRETRSDIKGNWGRNKLPVVNVPRHITQCGARGFISRCLSTEVLARTRKWGRRRWFQLQSGGGKRNNIKRSNSVWGKAWLEDSGWTWSGIPAYFKGLCMNATMKTEARWIAARDSIIHASGTRVRKCWELMKEAADGTMFDT